MTERTRAQGNSPEDFDRDLRPDSDAGQNHGPETAHKQFRSAYELKELHNRLQSFSDAELRQIVVVPEGMRLEQGAVYLDLRNDQMRGFKARGDMHAEAGSCYVPKSEVDYQLWNRLIGVDNPERIGEADDI